MYYSQSPHGTSPGHGKQSGVNGILVHNLYGCVRFPEIRCCTAAVSCVQTLRKLGRTVTVVHKVYDSDTAHGTSSGRRKKSGANGTFVHPIYYLYGVLKSDAIQLS